MKSRSIILSIVGVATLCGFVLPSVQQLFAQKQPASRKAPLQIFMQRKLEATQLILEGLVTDQHSLIGKGADQLDAIANAAEWQAANDENYKQHSDQFMRIVQHLRKTAKGKDLDAAALTYVELTMNCIHCHNDVRGNRASE